MSDYEINLSTLLLISKGRKETLVYEKEDNFICNLSSSKIIDNSCKFFGCSLKGRQDGAKSILLSSVKVPIFIEESKGIIFFPTASPRIENCIWVSYNNLIKYEKIDNGFTRLYFVNNKEVEVCVSYNIIDNQVTRCIKLEKEILRRKKEF